MRRGIAPLGVTFAMRRLGSVAGLTVAAALAGGVGRAQLPLPTEEAPADGATLFANQCGTCHTVDPTAPPRQGPNLAHVFGRRAGSLDGFKYSAGFANVVFVWDEARLDAWLTNPQAVIGSAVMLYRQRDPAKRKTIIDWLKEQP
jgi:cytochrome c